MLFFKNMFYYMAKIGHVFFFLFIYFIASKTRTEKKQKLHTINKVIKRKKEQIKY